MCLIVEIPKGKTLDYDTVDSAYEYNPDGIGIMVNGTAQKWKHLTPLTIHAKLEELKDEHVAVHFRWATDGKVNKANAHPFRLSNKSYLMHNGVLSKYSTGRNAEMSDTRKFIKDWCEPMIKKHGSLPTALFEQEIFGNAMLIMQTDGAINRYGQGWVKHFGCWFSNEYAWDAPGRRTGYKKNRAGDYILDMPDTEGGSIRTVDWNRTADDETADLILSRIHTLVDVLPLNTPDYICYEDMQLYDDLLSSFISEDEFLEMCTGETLLNLYTWAAQQNYYLG